MNTVLNPEHWPALCLGAISFRILQKNPDASKATEDKVLEDRDADQGRIRCPLCFWRPKASSRWFCASVGPPEYYAEGCGTSWNTFDTRGKCPGCGHQWRWTACLSCHRESLHEDWYLKRAE